MLGKISHGITNFMKFHGRKKFINGSLIEEAVMHLFIIKYEIFLQFYPNQPDFIMSILKIYIYIYAKIAVIFNNTCLNENLPLRFSNINPHDPAVRNEPITIEYRKQLVKRQLEIKKEETIRLETILQTQYEELYNLMNNNQEYDVVKNALSHQSLRATEAAKI